MNLLASASSRSIPVVSVDIPSGWDVEKGPSDKYNYMPDVLVSLSAPKLCAKYFEGKHFLGGRFIPTALAEKYSLILPEFPGTDCFVQLK